MRKVKVTVLFGQVSFVDKAWNDVTVFDTKNSNDVKLAENVGPKFVTVTRSLSVPVIVMRTVDVRGND